MTDDLAAAGARWDDDPTAGEWILPHLGEFGPAVDAIVPPVYDAYAVVPFPRDPDGDVRQRDAYRLIDDLLERLRPVTGDQPVHVGLWEGWGFLYDHGTDPVTAPGMAALYVSDERPRWWHRGRRARADREELRRVQAEAAAELAAMRVERPDAAPLDYPHRSRFLWTGPLRSALALRRHDVLPSVVWPEGRSWFLGIPEYAREAALGGPADLVEAVLTDGQLGARRATPSTVLDIDD